MEPDPRVTSPRDSRRPGDAALLLCAFASGAAALVYEIAWARMLSLSFGTTTLAVSAVVAAFLGGMGIGAWLHHRVLRRFGRPLLLYALLEVGIAASAVAVTLAIAWIPSIVVALPEAAQSGGPLALARFAIVFVVLALPSILMGATFPALCTVLISSREAAQDYLGRLYGVNTIGAALGALATGLLLIELLGVERAVLAGAAVNVAVALLALAARRWLPVRHVDAAPAPDLAPGPVALPVALTAAVLVLSGFATLSYEILWFRALHYLFGGSTYAVTLMLAIFLLGLGFGALSFPRIAARFALEPALAATQLGIALLALVAIGVEALLLADKGLEQHVSIFYESIYGMAWWKRLALQAGIATAMMLPAALLMGLSFPLASLALVRRGGPVSAPVGRSALLANLGSIAGSLSAALVTLPLLGTVGGTRAIAALNLALGFAVATRTRWTPRHRAAIAVGTLSAAGALVLAMPAKLAFEGAGFGVGDPAMLFEQETDLGTVQVWQDRRKPESLGMTIDGAVVGVSGPSHYPIYLKQLLLAHLPFAIDARLERPLVVGLASASTVEALALHDGVRELSVVEISGAVERGSRFFPQSEALADPRVRLEIEDILHFLLRSDDRYDLIVSDGKQAMDYSGNSRQLSREFYELALERLTGDGLFIQWVSTHMLPSDFRVILRTFATTFPETEVFFDLPESVLMVGAKRPLAGRPRMTPEQFAALGLDRQLAPLGIDGPGALLSKWIASRDQILAAVGDGPISTWDRSPLEFSPYRSSPADWRRGMPVNLGLLLRAQAERPSAIAADFAPPGSPRATSTRLLREAHRSAQIGDLPRAQTLARRAAATSPEDPSVRHWSSVILGRSAPRVQ
jgi:spermidine synthase